MATSSNYDQTSFDYATQSHRQTGSAFKVFSLMTLIHDYQGDPNQTYYKSQELLPGWLPGYPTYHVQTSEHSYAGTISIAHATTVSDNTVFAQLAQDLTLDHVTATAHAMGITSPLTGFPSEALGAVGVSPLEMADAYATIANGGNHVPPTAIEKVVFPDGSVKVLGDPPKKRVFTDGEAYAATQVLKTVIQSGTGTAANIGCPAAGKTGTTSSFTDAYFVGYTPKLTTAVWVGYPNSTISMNDVNGLGPGFGGTLAAPIWHDYMTKAIGGYCSDFTTPNNPFQGTAFFGKFATTGSSASNSSGSGSSGATTTGGAGVTTSTTSTTPTTPKTTSTGGGTHTTPLGPGTTGTQTTGGAGAGGRTTTSATGVHGAPPGFGGGHKP
jgi:penicillin-binding protein 1A